MAMNKIQEKWLTALESGKHKQGNGHLCKNNKYCCLGVACEVLGLKKEYNEGIIIYFSREIKEDLQDSNFTYLPDGIAKEIGLINSSGTMESSQYSDLFYEALYEEGYKEDQKNSLVKYNDSGATFEQIAYAIRKVPQAVFVEEG